MIGAIAFASQGSSRYIPGSIAAESARHKSGSCLILYSRQRFLPDSRLRWNDYWVGGCAGMMEFQVICTSAIYRAQALLSARSPFWVCRGFISAQLPPVARQ